jgi:hypothetical protein
MKTGKMQLCGMKEVKTQLEMKGIFDTYLKH